MDHKIRDGILVTDKTGPIRSSQPAGNPRQAKKAPSVLFVCTANIVRSPMAAALLRDRLQKERPDWQDWRIESAGTWALDGEMAAKNSRLAMTRRGLDISSHRARTVDGAMLASFDLILTMEPGQKEALQVEFPTLARRIFLLSEMEGLQQPVDDPHGGPAEAYEETAKKIDQMIRRGLSKIIELVNSQT